MADDLLDDLTTYCLCSHVDYGWYYSVGSKGCPLCQAKAEIKRLRAVRDAIDDLHSPRIAHDTCVACDQDWPCPTQMLINPNEARRDY